MSDDKDPTPVTDADARDAHTSDAAKPVSRRAALKVLGTVPVAGALLGGVAFAQQGTPTQQSPQLPKQTHETASPPAEGTGKNPPKNQAKYRFFSAAEMRTVGVLADDIIPRDARSGSATDAGVPAFIDYHLSVPETSDDLRVAMRGGLAWLNTEARTRFKKNYASLTADQRHQILDDIAWPERTKPGFSQGTAFFSRFRDFVGAGFFSSAAGWKDLQYQGNVFNPNWQGCPPEAMKKLGVSFALMDTRIAPDQPTG
jgi:gluconate 2-dehydrogenase gamma chain